VSALTGGGVRYANRHVDINPDSVGGTPKRPGYGRASTGPQKPRPNPTYEEGVALTKATKPDIKQNEASLRRRRPHVLTQPRVNVLLASL
jgi:hypothetical protein